MEVSMEGTALTSMLGMLKFFYPNLFLTTEHPCLIVLLFRSCLNAAVLYQHYQVHIIRFINFLQTL